MERCSSRGAPQKPDGDEPVRSPKNTSVNLHSIINKGLIPVGQNSSKRQTVFFLPIDPRDKDHEDPEHIDFSVPRRAQYLHSAWKKHQDAVFWVDIDLAIRKGLTFYQTRSNAIILQATLPAYCIPKVVRLKTGEVLYEKSTYLLDHHQRSHYDSISIGPEGMMNWVVQLYNSQSVNSSISLVEKFNMKRSPNQPNQNPYQSVIDRGNLINCLNTFVLSVLTMEQGNLLSKTAQAHTQ